MPASTWTLWIPGWHPTPLNKLMHGHWSIGAKRKKADAQQVATAVRAYGVPPAICSRRLEVLIVLGKGQRACDPDAYLKSLLDALVLAGALKNDNRTWVEWFPPRFARGEIAATYITLSE